MNQEGVLAVMGVVKFINQIRKRSNMAKGKIRHLPKQLLSRKIISVLIDDFAFYGSVPFFLLVILWSYFTGLTDLFWRLSYTFLLSVIVILVVKGIHYKERPRAEEFSIFMEKI